MILKELSHLQHFHVGDWLIDYLSYTPEASNKLIQIQTWKCLGERIDVDFKTVSRTETMMVSWSKYDNQEMKCHAHVYV